jgi:hypothetical protein
VVPVEDFLQGVQRAGADVAEDDADGGDDDRPWPCSWDMFLFFRLGGCPAGLFSASESEAGKIPFARIRAGRLSVFCTAAS